MRRILLDTNAYSRFCQNDANVIKILQHSDEVGIPIIVLGELLAGFAYGTQKQKNQQLLDEFLSSPRIRILIADEDTAAFYAKIYTQLRQAGTPIPTNDLWIAAIAMQNGFWVCSFDQHLKQVPGLVICTNPIDLMY